MTTTYKDLEAKAHADMEEDSDEEYSDDEDSDDEDSDSETDATVQLDTRLPELVSDIQCIILHDQGFHVMYKDLRPTYRIGVSYNWIQEERLRALCKKHGIPFVESREDYVAKFGN